MYKKSILTDPQWVVTIFHPSTIKYSGFLKFFEDQYLPVEIRKEPCPQPIYFPYHQHARHPCE